jgi:hypothetical protein
MRIRFAPEPFRLGIRCVIATAPSDGGARVGKLERLDRA